MRLNTILAVALAAVMVGGTALTPSVAMAQGKGKGQVKSKNKSSKGKSYQSKSHWNPAPPKKNGRHDNRNWNKDRDDRDRRDDDRWREDDRRYQTRERNDDRGRIFGSSSTRTRSTSSYQRELERRQRTKNEWRNIAYASGAVALLGLINKDDTLVFAGTAGALYSLHRYEQDRKSQNKLERLRADYFSRPYFYRDGVRYQRVVMIKNGEKHYQFLRSRS